MYPQLTFLGLQNTLRRGASRHSLPSLSGPDRLAAYGRRPRETRVPSAAAAPAPLPPPPRPPPPAATASSFPWSVTWRCSSFWTRRMDSRAPWVPASWARLYGSPNPVRRGPPVRGPVRRGVNAGEGQGVSTQERATTSSKPHRQRSVHGPACRSPTYVHGAPPWCNLPTKPVQDSRGRVGKMGMLRGDVAPPPPPHPPGGTRQNGNEGVVSVVVVVVVVVYARRNTAVPDPPAVSQTTTRLEPQASHHLSPTSRSPRASAGRRSRNWVDRGADRITHR